MREEQRQRLRAAKRRNRKRRLRRWKDNTKTVPPCLQELRRQLALIRRTADAISKALSKALKPAIKQITDELPPAIKQITDCLGGIPGGVWAAKEKGETAVNRNIPKFYVCEEMQKLRDGLDERKIPWKDLTDKDGLWICRTHFRIKGDSWSVVHGYGSYGGFNSFEKDKQLLECMYGGNEPDGWLTAAEVLKMVDEKKGGGSE